MTSIEGARLPAGWQRVRLSRVMASPITAGVDFSAEALQGGLVRYIRTTDITGLRSLVPATAGVGIEQSDVQAASVQRGDVLMTRSGSLGTSYLHESDESMSYAGYLVRARADGCRCCPKYLAWWTQSADHLDQVAVGATRSTIDNFSASKFAAMSFPLPPIATQRAISDFLDRETAKIDALIEKQHELIGLLKERRRAVAALAVRYGIRGAAVADHPAPAVGVLPEGWTAQPVKHALVSLDGRRIPLSAEERGDRQGEYPYYGASGVIDHVDDFLFDEELVLVSEDGANLLMRSTPIAFTAEGRYWVNNHAHVMRPRFGPARYWAHRIEASDLAPFVTGSAQPKFTADALSKLVISWPTDPSEMTEIVEHLDRETTKIDTLIAKAEEHIELARERRSALITAAVTGQIEVPEAA